MSGLADLSDLAGLSDLMPAKLLSKAGKSWLTAQTSSAIHAGLADFFDFLALPPAFGGILSHKQSLSLDRTTSRYAYMFSFYKGRPPSLVLRGLYRTLDMAPRHSQIGTHHSARSQLSATCGETQTIPFFLNNQA